MAKKQKYEKIYDASSYMLLRTNPILTTNVKLVYDDTCDDVYMSAYRTGKTLSEGKYQKFHINADSSFYNEDIRRFWNQGKVELPREVVYKGNQVVKDTSFINDASIQFERMYTSKAYRMNDGKFAAESTIYLKKQLPDYIVIFKMKGPTTLAHNEKGELVEPVSYDFVKSMEIVKTIDITENTRFGRYIRRYVNQEEFYDSPFLLNGNSLLIRGIDYKSGSLTSITKDISNVIRQDACLNVENWKFASMFYENNMVEMNILNIQVVFDDELAEPFDVNRYFIMFCNNIELLKLTPDRYELVDIPNKGIDYSVLDSSITVSGNKTSGPLLKFSDYEDIQGLVEEGKPLLLDYSASGNQYPNKCFYTMSDKYGRLHEVKLPAMATFGQYNKEYECIEREIDAEKFCSMEAKSFPVRYKALESEAHDVFCFTTYKENFSFVSGSWLKVIDTLYTEDDDEYCPISVDSFLSVEDFQKAINEKSSLLTVYTYESEDKIYVCLKNAMQGSRPSIKVLVSEEFMQSITPELSTYEKVQAGYFLNMTGGTDDGLKAIAVKSSLVKVFTDGRNRYIGINTGNENSEESEGACRFAKIIYVNRMVFDDKLTASNNTDYNFTFLEHSDEKTDRNELEDYIFLTIESPLKEQSGTVEIYTEFKPVVGMLSFFPVRDMFSYNDYVVSEVGSDVSFRSEVENIVKETVRSNINEVNVNITTDADNDDLNRRGTLIENATIMRDGNMVMANITDKPDHLSTLIFTTDKGKPTGKVGGEYTYYGAKSSITPITDSAIIGFMDIVDVRVKDKFKYYLSPVNIKNSGYTCQLFDSNEQSLDSEYGYYVENYIPELADVNRTMKVIPLFCYRNQGLDGLSYRMNLNFTKIFRETNICPALSLNKVSILDYTHDIGFYLNEYYSTNNTQGRVYVEAKKHFDSTEEWMQFTVKDWVNKFVTDDNAYYDLFESENPYYQRSIFFSEIYNTDLGCEALLKGVKFKIGEAYADGTAADNSGYFCGWKITILNIPIFNVEESEDYSKLSCVINYRTKYILFLRFFELLENEDSEFIEDSEDEKAIEPKTFTRSLLYILASKSVEYSSYQTRNAYSFKEAVNNIEYNLFITEDSEESEPVDEERLPVIRVEEPKLYNINDFFKPVEKIDTTYQGVNRYVDIQQIENPGVLSIYRYNGEYEVQAKDIMYFVNSPYGRSVEKKLPYSNTFINMSVMEDPGGFNIPFILNESYHRLISEGITFTGDTKYPSKPTYPVAYKQTDIFKDNLCTDYFIRTTNIYDETYDVLENMNKPVAKESYAYFGSRVIKLPDAIKIDTLDTGSIDMSKRDVSDYIYKEMNKDVVYRETDDEIEIYLLLNNRLTGKIIDDTPLYDTLIKGMAYDEAEDKGYPFMEEYIRKNILQCYAVGTINVYLKRTVSDDVKNDYSEGVLVPDSDKEQKGYELLENPVLKDTRNHLIKKIVITKEKHTAYSFSFSIDLVTK